MPTVTDRLRGLTGQVRHQSRRVQRAIDGMMHATTVLEGQRQRIEHLEAQVERQDGALKDMDRRLHVVQDEVQEARRLNQHIAELADLVGEALLPVEHRRDEDIASRLEAYLASR